MQFLFHRWPWILAGVAAAAALLTVWLACHRLARNGLAFSWVEFFRLYWYQIRRWLSSETIWRRLKALGALLGVIAIFAGLLVVVQYGPAWQLRREGIQIDAKTAQPNADEIAKLQDEYRKTILQALAGVLVLAGLWYTRRRILISEQGQITERYTRAIEQLGAVKACGENLYAPNTEVRLGAIYALERIARDSARDHWTIMEVLTAYVRENAPAKSEEELAKEPPGDRKPATEIQAILTVLGRRQRGSKRERPGKRLDLSSTDLRGADFSCLHFEKTLFSNAQLDRSNFDGADLNCADFSAAHLIGVDFFVSCLDWAYFETAESLTTDQILQAASWSCASFDPEFSQALDEAWRKQKEPATDTSSEG